MGICTKGKDTSQDNITSTKAILHTETFGKLQFYFTTENLLRIDANCLVLFCDQKMNLSKNTFIANIGSFQTKKIKEFALSYLQSSKKVIIPGEIIFFPISISTLQFKFIGMVCLKSWNSEEKMSINLEPIIVNLFNDLNERKVESLAITEFNEQFGIPAQLASKIMTKALFQNRSWLRIVTLICNSPHSQEFYMQKIERYNPLRPTIDERTVFNSPSKAASGNTSIYF